MNMHRRQFLRAAVIAAGAGGAGMWPLQSSADAPGDRRPRDRRRGNRPNVLLIMADDMGFSDVGCYGGEIHTPNLDRLAQGGLRFTQHYSTGRCWPSRACILTGYYAQHIRRDVIEGVRKGNRPPWAPLLTEAIGPEGYRCYHSGKWHIDGKPLECGFDRSYYLADQDRFFSPQRHFKDDVELPAVESGTDYYATTAIADHAVNCLKEHADQYSARPFFHYLAFTAPHFPLHALQKDIDRYRDSYLDGWDAIRERRWKRMTEMGIINCPLSEFDTEILPPNNLDKDELKDQIGPGEAPRAVPWKSLTDEQKRFQATKMAIHAAMIDRVDREIGRVLDQLKAMGAYEDTVIFFVSDNGASAEQIIRGDLHDTAAPPGSANSYLCLGPGWSSAANTPFRLHKMWTTEGGISSPLIIHWPDGIHARGQLRNGPTHFIDIAPTILELAGAHWPGIRNGKPVPPKPGISLVPAFMKEGAVEHEFLWWYHAGHPAVRVGDWKLVSKARDEPWELYDLKHDRCEMKNVASQHPEMVAELTARWNSVARKFREDLGSLEKGRSRKN